MNKSDLREAVQRDLECNAAIADRAVTAVVQGIMEGLKSDGSVQLMGFGTFLVKDRKSRIGRHPTTGKPMEIPAARVVQFRPARRLKESF